MGAGPRRLILSVNANEWRHSGVGPQIAWCTVYYNLLLQDYGAKAVDVILNVQQTEWDSGVTSAWPDVQEMIDAVIAIVNDCDTTTTTAKWGGYQSVSVTVG